MGGAVGAGSDHVVGANADCCVDAAVVGPAKLCGPHAGDGGGAVVLCVAVAGDGCCACHRVDDGCGSGVAAEFLHEASNVVHAGAGGSPVGTGGCLGEVVVIDHVSDGVGVGVVEVGGDAVVAEADHRVY